MPVNFYELIEEYRNTIVSIPQERVTYVSKKPGSPTRLYGSIVNRKENQKYMRFDSMNSPTLRTETEEKYVVTKSPKNSRTYTPISQNSRVSGTKKVIYDVIEEENKEPVVRRRGDYSTVRPKVDTNLVKNPIEVIDAIQTDHGIRRDGEELWSPGKRVTSTSGVYATSDNLTKGHVGINRVNPIYENIRNLEQDQANHTSLYWRDKSSDGYNRSELVVREESDPVVRRSRSPKKVYQSSGGSSVIRSSYVRDGARYIEDRAEGEQPQYEVVIKKSGVVDDQGVFYRDSDAGLRMSLDGFEKTFSQFEGFKKGLPASMDENTKLKMFLDHLEQNRADSPTKISPRKSPSKR